MYERLPIPSLLQGMVWHLQADRRFYPRHRHRELELNLCVRGTAVYMVKRVRIEVHPKSLVWLFPAQPHQLIRRSNDYEMWIAVFKQPVVREAASEPASAVLRKKDPPGIFCKTLPRAAAEWIEELMRDLQTRKSVATLFNHGLSYALGRIWDSYQRAGLVPDAADVHPAVEKAAHLLARESDSLNGSELAKACGLSRARLSHLFKEQMKISLSDYRNRQRLERFFSYYRSGQRTTMLAAALQAGFGSYAQFHRVYRKIMGEFPRSAKLLIP